MYDGPALALCLYSYSTAPPPIATPHRPRHSQARERQRGIRIALAQLYCDVVDGGQHFVAVVPEVVLRMLAVLETQLEAAEDLQKEPLDLQRGEPLAGADHTEL